MIDIILSYMSLVAGIIIVVLLVAGVVIGFIRGKQN